MTRRRISNSKKCLGTVLALVTVGAASRAYVGLPSTDTSGRKSTEHIVTYKADLYNYQENAAKQQIVTLTGNVDIHSENTTMTSDLATYNEKTGVANSPGHLKIDDSQNTVIGDTGVAFYARRDARISGGVKITVRPKQEAGNAPQGSLRSEFKDPVYITCDNVDYNWRSRVAVATGHLTFKMKDRTVTATKATYYGAEERVQLDGSVHYTRTNGDKGDAPTATAIVREGHEQFSAKNATTVVIVHDEPDADTPATPPPAARPPAGAAPRRVPGTLPRPPAGTPPSSAPSSPGADAPAAPVGTSGTPTPGGVPGSP